MQQNLGFDLGDETQIAIIGVQGKTYLHTSTISYNASHDSDKIRSELFHIRVVAKHMNIEILFDPSAQVNLIFESVVKKLGLETRPHPRPYPLGSVCDNEILMPLSSVGSYFIWNQI